MVYVVCKLKFHSIVCADIYYFEHDFSFTLTIYVMTMNLRVHKKVNVK